MPQLSQLKRHIAIDSRRPYFAPRGREADARWPAMVRKVLAELPGDERTVR